MTQEPEPTEPMPPGLKPISQPELVFGLVGAVGANLALVREVLEEELKKVSYGTRHIHVTDLLYQLRVPGLPTKGRCAEEIRINGLMDAGNRLRRLSQRNDIMALLAIYKIRDLRAASNRKKRKYRGHPADELAKLPNAATAYVIHSLKTPDEIRVLRETYGRAFFVISAYAPSGVRARTLARRLRSGSTEAAHSSNVAEAWRLIHRDQKEDDPFGQNVRNAFPHADLFVDASTKQSIKESVNRFVELLFGHPFHTPTRDEAAMFHAHSASLRSADLARQVGCALTTQGGEVIALGCNDVPKANGGLYWPEDEPDGRDFRIGFDSSDRSRRDIVSELITRLREANWLSESLMKESDSVVSARILDGPERSILKGAQIANVIEYGRSVHAEMATISDAARRGLGIRAATMYCTTFPCHICARHIIVSGIGRLVYIEPYPKSKTEELYSDSVVLDPVERTEGKVVFESFVGIGPFNYCFLFDFDGERKDRKGLAATWRARDAIPKLRRFVCSYIDIEGDVLVNYLSPSLERAKIEI